MEKAPEGAIETTTTSSTTSTEPEIFYYSIPSSGLCAIVDNKTPSWLTEKDYYTDWKQCCRAGWKFEQCMSRAPPGSIKEETTQPTRSPSHKPTTKPSLEPTSVPDPTLKPSLHPVTDKPVSSAPTKSPVEIDSYESSCENAGPWHPTSDYSKCTNE